MIFVELKYNPRLTPAERIMVALPAKLRDFRPIMRTYVAPEMNRMLLRHWTTQGAAFGHPWAPWARSTRSARLRKGNVGKGILRDTDHLFTSIFRERSTDNRLRLVNGGVQLAFNTRIPYAIYHQVGTRFMPERQVFPYPIPDSFKTTVRNIIRSRLLSPEPV